MRLSLSEEQARELKQALDLHLRRLEDEAIHTDDRAYRTDLQESYDILDSIRRELAFQAEEPTDYAPATDFPAVR